MRAMNLLLGLAFVLACASEAAPPAEKPSPAPTAQAVAPPAPVAIAQDFTPKDPVQLFLTGDNWGESAPCG